MDEIISYDFTIKVRTIPHKDSNGNFFKWMPDIISYLEWANTEIGLKYIDKITMEDVRLRLKLDINRKILGALLDYIKTGEDVTLTPDRNNEMFAYECDVITGDKLIQCNVTVGPNLNMFK